MTMIVMLGVLFMLITRASDVRTWKWLAGETDTEIWNRAGQVAQVDPSAKDESAQAPSAVEPPKRDDPKVKEPLADDLQFKDPDLPNAAPTPREPAIDDGSQNKPSAPDKTTLSPDESKQPDQNQPTSKDDPAAEDTATKPTGPTDLDPEELLAAQEHYQVLSDRTLELQPEEMPIYWRQFFWTQNQTFEQMEKRANRKVVLNQFMQRPSEQRGKLVRLDMYVKRVLEYDAPVNSAGIEKIYEIWGRTNESGAWLYCVVTAELPPQMPIGPSVNEKATVVGYFLKLQGYHAAGAGPKDKALAAPLLVGRVQWKPSTKPEIKTDAEFFGWWWWLIIAAAALIGLRLVLPLFFTRRSEPIVSPVRREFDRPDEAKVGDWLAQAKAGDVPPADPRR